MVCPQQTHELALLMTARRRKNFCAEMACKLDCCNAHPARAAVNQHTLAGTQPREFAQRIPGGKKRGGNGGGFLEGHTLGFLSDRRHPRTHTRCERCRRETKHGIAWLERGDASSGPHNPSRQLHPDRRASEAV